MALRNQVEWNHSLKRIIGYVDYGTIIEETENLLLAKEALVYLLTGTINGGRFQMHIFLWLVLQ